MYGQQKLNDHLVIRYGLTCAFYKLFAPLKYKQLSIPTAILREWQSYIQPSVDQLMSQPKRIQQFQRYYGLNTARDIQRNLSRYLPSIQRNLARYRHRQAILVPAALYPLVSKLQTDHQLIVLVQNQSDAAILRKHAIKPHTKLFRLKRAITRVKLPIMYKSLLAKRIKQLCDRSLPSFFKTRQFRQWLFRKSVAAIKRIEVLEELIRREEIGLILHENTLDYPGNTLALLAKKFALPFIFIQNHMHSLATILPAQATAYCVWGNHYQKWLSRMGVHPTRIHTTGWQQLNRLQDYQASSAVALATLGDSQAIRHHVCEHYSVPVAQRLIVWTTQSFPSQVNRTLLTWLRQAVANQPLTLLIKRHPSDTACYKELPHNIKIADDRYMLYDLLTAADLVLTVSSTTGIEAALLGKGLLIAQPPLPYHYYKNYDDFHSHLARANAGYIIRNQHEAINIFNKISREQEVISELSRQASRFAQASMKVGNPVEEIGIMINRFLIKAPTQAAKSFKRQHEIRELGR